MIETIDLREVSKEDFRDVVETHRAYAEVSFHEDDDDQLMNTYYISSHTDECVGVAMVTDDGVSYWVPENKDGAITLQDAYDLIYGA